MLEFSEEQIGEAMDRAVDRCIHLDDVVERTAAIRRAMLEEGVKLALAAFSWSDTPPSAPGLYAVVMPSKNGGAAAYGVVEVMCSPLDNELLFAGGVRVADALAGTRWHRLSPLPSEDERTG